MKKRKKHISNGFTVGKELRKLYGVASGWINTFLLTCSDRVNGMVRDNQHYGACLRGELQQALKTPNPEVTERIYTRVVQ